MSVIIIYLIIYGLLIGGVVFGGFVLHLGKSKLKKGNSNISAGEITLLIPFRNEEKRLDVLLTSIVNSDKLPSRIIFIDDHSDDASVELIQKRLGHLSHEIMSLSGELSGKKLALRAAIATCRTRFILTFDADVSFGSNYFSAIEELDEADMYVLPAILVGRSSVELFYELDVALANALNVGLSGLARPIFSSGANFLFKRQVFDEVDDFDSHAHMSSGDDTYLLRDFRNNNKDIRLETNLNVSITTETPHSFKEFIDQRLRWIGKTTDIADSLATIAALGQFFMAIAFFGGVMFTAIIGSWFEFTVLFTAKIGMDLMFFLPFFLRTKRYVTWCLIPIYELLFPIYSLMLGVLMLTYRPRWKGRDIHRQRG